MGDFLISERRKWLDYHGFYGKTYFWRNKSQAEIDFVEEIGGMVYANEFKWNAKAKVKLPSAFIDSYNPLETKVIHPENFWQWLRSYPY